MKWIKKVAETPLEAIAKVIDSFTSGADKVTNAPSIRAVEDALDGKASAGDLMTLAEELNAEMATKATKAELESATSELETALDDKVDTLDFQNYQVQIQEQLSEVENTKANRANMIISRDYSYNYEITAGTYAQISATNLGITAISGYTPIGFRKVYAGSRYMNISLSQAVTSGTVVGMTNTNSATVTGTLAVTIIFIRNDVTEG